MSASAWGLLALFFALLLLLAWPVGKFLAALCNERVPRWMARVEAPFYKLAGVAPSAVDELARLRDGAAGLQRGRRAGGLRPRSGCRACCRSTPPAWARCRPTRLSTPP